MGSLSFCETDRHREARARWVGARITTSAAVYSGMGDDTETDDPPFECELCDDRFETREELRDHIWEYHEMDGDVTT